MIAARVMTLVMMTRLVGCGPSWPQWGQNPQHTGSAPIAAQTPARILADIVYDPFVSAEQADSGGDLLVHYQAPLISGDDVFMAFKTGQWISCNPPGPSPCGSNAWNSQVWSVRRLHWENGALVEKWRFESDWKPEPDAGGLGGWEPVFHAILVGGFVYAPGSGGTVFKLNRDDGSVLARLNPFDSIDAGTFVAGPLAADSAGAVYYNALQLDLSDPWGNDAAGAWLVRIGADDSATKVTFASLTPGAPAAGDACLTTFASRQLPWPPSPSAVPAAAPCGSERPGLNIAPAIAPDGTIYTVSRAHRNSQYAYLIAANADLSAKWAASLRGRLNDGCGSAIMRPTGSSGGCRAGAPFGVDPATNQAPAGRVIDNGSASPVVAPDGSILFGAYTRYNYARGHLFQFSAQGNFLAAYDFGWDTTPAVYSHDGTYSVILKDNHYDVGTYCDDASACPTAPPGPYLITQLDSNLRMEWSWQNTNTMSCSRASDGSLACASDHPGGFEWCVNAPAADASGAVYANSEDGNLYVIGQGGALRANLFLDLALGAAYTPISIGADGLIYAQNAGHLFVLGDTGNVGVTPQVQGIQ
jgi:hypothetical protein